MKEKFAPTFRRVKGWITDKLAAMNGRFFRQVLIFAIGYYLFLLLWGGIIFLLSHIPPPALNLDGLLLRMGPIQSALVWPRALLRKLWPGERTPAILNYILPVMNCLFWGLALAGLKKLLRRS